MNFTEQLAFFILSMHEKKLDEDLYTEFKKLYLDYLCASLLGSQTEVGRKVFDYYHEFDKSEVASVFGHSTRLSHINAAFVNGTSAHCLDFDDGYTKGSFHPGAVIFSAALAVAEKYRSSKEDVIRSVIVGYEISIRIASIIHPASREKGFHNTPVAGIFGASAAVSFLLGSNHEQIVSAFGNALSFAGGTFAFLGSGSEVKRIHPGKAASEGIIAAELANKGLTGPSNIFEKKDGVFEVISRNKINKSLLDTPLGETFEIKKVYIKLYPCCRHLHVVIDAIKKAKKDFGLSWDHIQDIQIGVNKISSYHCHKVFQSMLDAQMSIPFVVATALLDGDISVKSFEHESMNRAEIRQLVELINVLEDEECEKVYPEKRKTNLIIKTKTNETVQLSYDGVKGEYPNPISLTGVESKFLNNCMDVLGENLANQILSKVRELDFLNMPIFNV